MTARASVLQEPVPNPATPMMRIGQDLCRACAFWTEGLGAFLGKIFIGSAVRVSGRLALKIKRPPARKQRCFPGPSETTWICITGASRMRSSVSRSQGTPGDIWGAAPTPAKLHLRWR